MIEIFEKQFRAIVIAALIASSLIGTQAFASWSELKCKDPRCIEMCQTWKNHFSCEDFPTPVKCALIASFGEDEYGKKTCTSSQGDKFNCTGIDSVKSPLIGLNVRLWQKYIDMCKIPGGCGSISCKPWGELVATIDASCQ